MDSGASRTVVTHTVWEQYCADMRRPPCLFPSKALRALSGDEIPVLGTGTMRILGLDLPVFVVRNLRYHEFVLGDDSLKTLCAVINSMTDQVSLLGTVYDNIGVEVTPDYLVHTSISETAEDYWRHHFPDLFGDGSGGPVGCHPSVEFGITLLDNRPIAQRPYRAPLLKRQVIEEHVQGLMDQGIVRPSNSPYASPVILVPKHDGGVRMCVDYRKLNSVTRKDAYPLPRIQDILDEMGNSKIYTTLDLRSGYYQLPVKENSIPLTAFVTHHGLFEFTRMPFGLCNAPAVFQRCMQHTLRSVLGKFCRVFLDDIVVYSASKEEHHHHVQTVLKILEDTGFTLKSSKCTFSAGEVDLLGFKISGDGVHPQEEKIKVIKDMKPPTDVKQVRRFLGMLGFYRTMIPNFAYYASHLTDLTKKHARWMWEQKHQVAFDHLRLSLCSNTTMLHYPDLNTPYELYTDASDRAVGAVLIQRDDQGRGRPIQFISHTLNDTQRRWPAMEREAYAIIHALKVLRPYLYGAQFVIYTDHKPLKAMFLGEVKNSKVQRWAMLISEYGAPIRYIRGENNVRADFLSRLPRPAEECAEDQICLYQLAPEGDLYYKGQLTADGIDPELFRRHQQEAFSHLLTNDKEFVKFEDFICTTRHPRGALDYPRLWVPDAYKVQLVTAYHEQMGHAGTRKLLAKLGDHYKWPSMWKTINTVYRQCALCRVHSDRISRPSPTRMPVAQCPGDIVAFDLIGPFPESPYGNRYCVTALDHSTAWLECYPIPSKTQANVFRAIANEWIPRHGVPRVVITDQGLEFRGKELEDYFATLSVDHRRSTPFHPQSNGRLERAHRTLKTILRKLVNTRAEMWEDQLAASLSAYRHTPGVNGFSPFFLLYGRLPTSLSQRLLQPEVPVETDAVNRYDLLTTAYQQAARNTEASQLANHNRLAAQSNATPLQPGDTVVLKVNERVALDPRWDHLYVVTNVRGSVVSIADQRTGHRKVVNRDKLLPVGADGWENVQHRVKRGRRPPRHTTAAAPPAPLSAAGSRRMRSQDTDAQPATDDVAIDPVGRSQPVNLPTNTPAYTDPIPGPSHIRMDVDNPSLPAEEPMVQDQPIALRTRKRLRTETDDPTVYSKRYRIAAVNSILSCLFHVCSS